MLQSLMVYPNDNEFIHMASSILDDSMAKQLINADHIENFIGATSTSAQSSPSQEYLMAPPTYHPQQQHPNQRQHQLQFSVVPVMPTMVPTSHSAPSSPSYSIIKTEDVQAHQRMDYLMFPASFDLPSTATTTSASSTSPQMQQQRMIPFDASLIQQRQHHQQQQQQHDQQLRLQHQRALEQQQMMFDSPNHSAATTMSIPTTTAMMSSMTTAGAPTATPFFPSNIAYMPAAHPAAPKRKREESGQSLPRQASPQLMNTLESNTTTVPSNNNTNMDEPSRSTSPSLVTSYNLLPNKTSSPSSRPSTSSRLDKVKTSRSTKVTKFATSSTSSTSASPSIASTSTSALFPSDMLILTTSAQDSKATRATVTKKTPAKKSQSESRETSPIVTTDSSSPAPTPTPAPAPTGNVTHPRRAAQNRAAQRTFRNRRKAYIKELEQKVQEMDQTRELMDAIQRENQEVWRRLRILESMASQNGLQIPAFPALTHFSNHFDGANSNGAANSGMMMMNGHSNNPMMGSSNEEEEDEDEDMSDSYANSYSLLHQRQQQHPQQL
ncbi:hypothetical protein FBU30_010948 [Linnemannia zychae]|nr:hypothetical protein FBU30_010948 [Linnemannia zychae]